MSAVLLKTIAEARLAVAAARRRGSEIGFVPTMGALHKGHGELIRRAKAENGFVMVSVFVNPIQFDRNDDFQSYPRTLASDLEICSSLGADAVFAPAAEEMYPSRPLTFVEVLELGDGLCGAFRPGHFRGVATVVSKLLNIADADRAYFGEKDAQQLAIIARMAADLNFRCAIVPVATVREPDGLALSSRNRKLSPRERGIAPAIYRGLEAAVAALRAGSGPDEALRAARRLIEASGEPRIEYLEIVDPASMKPVQRIEGPVRIVTAVWLGNTRLIDNLFCAFGL
jgi:pantoate--beta-alanine ligase